MTKKLTDLFHVKPSDEVYEADQAVRRFLKSHKGKLNDSEHKELGNLLRNRAKALSEALGTKISSVADKD